MLNDVKILYAGKYLNLVQKNGWEFVTRNTHDVAIIFPVLDKSTIILIDEYRIPLNGRVIGLPAGLIGDVHESESIITGANRELEEETGYTAGSMEMVLKDSPSSSGMTSEKFNLLIARDLTKVSDGGGDETEDINVLIIPINELDERLKEFRERGYFIDPKIYMAMYFI